MITLSEVQAACEAAAEAIEELESHQWGGWVCYLLEALEEDGDVGETDLRRVLEGVKADIETRLEVGRW